jgi:hypothetical protein
MAIAGSPGEQIINPITRSREPKHGEIASAMSRSDAAAEAVYYQLIRQRSGFSHAKLFEHQQTELTIPTFPRSPSAPVTTAAVESDSNRTLFLLRSIGDGRDLVGREWPLRKASAQNYRLRDFPGR